MPQAWLPTTGAIGKVTIGRRHYYTHLRMPAQRLAEVRDTPTHAQLTYTITQLALCYFTRHWSGQRQLIAVHCIAEHA